jgi:hypothetical protein
VLPAPDGTGQTPSSLPPTFHPWLSAWIYDANNQLVNVSGANVFGSVFLLKTQ